MAKEWETVWHEPEDENEVRDYELRNSLQRAIEELGYVWTSEIVEDVMKRKLCRDA